MKWFAWYPVTASGKLVWLRWVIRHERTEEVENHPCHFLDHNPGTYTAKFYEYTLIEGK